MREAEGETEEQVERENEGVSESETGKEEWRESGEKRDRMMKEEICQDAT